MSKHRQKAILICFISPIIYKVYQCSVCQEAWPVKYRPRIANQYQCSRCTNDKQQPKKFSKQNNMIPSLVPSPLAGLTQVEEMLIARALPIMRVYVKPGGQRGYSGHCINLPHFNRKRTYFQFRMFSSVTEVTIDVFLL